MIHITKGIDQTILFTGSDLSVLENPNFLFIFTSSNEKVIKFVKPNISNTKRYNEVSITKNLFKKGEPGTWRYIIREQESETNTDISLSGGIIEQGFMYLHEQVVDESCEYNGNCNEFKSYSCE